MKLELQIVATHTEFEPARDRLVAFFEAGGLPPETVGELELVLEEVLVNVISYAYAGGDGLVGVTASIDDHAVSLEVRDTGLPFNPLERASPDLDAPIDERPVGGLGLVLVTQLASRLSYERRDDTNVLTIVKAI